MQTVYNSFINRLGERLNDRGIPKPFELEKKSEFEVVLRIPLPGLKYTDLKIDVCEMGVLRIQTVGKTVIQEFPMGDFCQSFCLTGGTRVERATLEDGVLTLVLTRTDKNAYEINIEPPDAKRYPGILNEDSVL